VTYYANFWLTVGAAAPVIALAGVVGITKSFKAVERLDSIWVKAEEPSWWRMGGPYFKAVALAAVVFGLGFINLLTQAVALFIALDSLAYNSNSVSPVIPLIILPVGIVVVAMSVMLAVVLATTVREAETAIREKEKHTQVARPSPKAASQPDKATSQSDDAALPTAAKPGSSTAAAEPADHTRPQRRPGRK